MQKSFYALRQQLDLLRELKPRPYLSPHFGDVDVEDLEIQMWQLQWQAGAAGLAASPSGLSSPLQAGREATEASMRTAEALSRRADDLWSLAAVYLDELWSQELSSPKTSAGADEGAHTEGTTTPDAAATTKPPEKTASSRRTRTPSSRSKPAGRQDTARRKGPARDNTAPPQPEPLPLPRLEHRAEATPEASQAPQPTQNGAATPAPPTSDSWMLPAARSRVEPGPTGGELFRPAVPTEENRSPEPSRDVWAVPDRWTPGASSLPAAGPSAPSTPGRVYTGTGPGGRHAQPRHSQPNAVGQAAPVLGRWTPQAAASAPQDLGARQERGAGVQGAGQLQADSNLSRCLVKGGTPVRRFQRKPLGIPASYNDGISWLVQGANRHLAGVFFGLLFGWTGLWILLWTAALGAAVGPLVLLGILPPNFLTAAFNIGVGSGLSALALVISMGLGAAGGFTVPLSLLFIHRPWETALSFVMGGVFSWIIVFGAAAFERTSLRIRGYRRLSQAEAGRIAPLVFRVSQAMDLPALPRFAIVDEHLGGAWAHMRTIVLTKGLLDFLDDGELEAVLAHELEHWRHGDAVGQRMVWAAALPIALMLNAGYLLSGRGPQEIHVTLSRTGAGSLVRGALRTIGQILFWPAQVITRMVITPAVRSTMREYEYEADRAAAAIGLAPQLMSALPKITSGLEGGRTGWEQAMARTHPPLALRLERLEPRQEDDAQYQEEELRASVGDALRMLEHLLDPAPKARSPRGARS
jgi:Zn-dependent protease with chaperone function